mmetsp:Transcript_43136/g.119277  ORF Transcript_43136/g.119277 Transcript_43136/m.119277 type:complete len:90 (+) Transcript_43136:139-408(+)|eukprot:3384894-Prymnesium_polylepis.1
MHRAYERRPQTFPGGWRAGVLAGQSCDAAVSHEAAAAAAIEMEGSASARASVGRRIAATRSGCVDGGARGCDPTVANGGHEGDVIAPRP